MQQQQLIPNGSTITSMENGDVTITYPGLSVPSLSVNPKSRDVRVAILRKPVDAALARAALKYVEQHLPR